MPSQTAWRLHHSGHIPEENIKLILKTIDLAEHAREHALPSCSKFKVGSALYLGNKRFSSGFNLEYGAGYNLADSRALHAESVALASALTQFGNDFKVEIIAVVADSEVPVCCGDCLDLLKNFSMTDTIIAAANPNRNVTLLNFENVFPSNFRKIDRQKVATEIGWLLDQARAASQKSIQPHSQQVMGLCGAALLFEGGQIISGVREDSTSFHPRFAIDSALVTAQNKGLTKALAIGLVSGTGYVAGMERQRVAEYTSTLPNGSSLPVYIWRTIDDSLFETTPSELLPYAFSSLG